MFVMFVLSHGEDGHVYALNGAKISIQKIMDYFDGSKCPALRQKPKLFFVQACQGGKLSTLCSLCYSCVWCKGRVGLLLVHITAAVPILFQEKVV